METFIPESRMPTILNDYKVYLTYRVSKRTARRYYWTIKRFVTSGYNPTVDHVNRFLYDIKARRNNKTAFKYLFDMLKMPEYYAMLVPIKEPPKKLIGAYLDKKKIMKVVERIENPIHKIIAMIQYDSGRRSHEIVQINRNNIATDSGGNMIFYTIGKGSKENYFRISKETEKKLVNFLAKERGTYPFIRSKSKDMLTAIDTNVTYYQRSLFKASKKAGIKIRTHDFRRNFAEDVYQAVRKHYLEHKINVDPIIVVQKLLGHSNIETTRGYLKQIDVDTLDIVRMVRG